MSIKHPARAAALSLTAVFALTGCAQLDTLTGEEDTGPQTELSADLEDRLAYEPVLPGDLDASGEDLTPITTEEALAILDNAPVERPNDSPYDRTGDFTTTGASWEDWDDNGCSTREDILTRDLDEKVMEDCAVTKGILDDPYTGERITFQRGRETSREVQIDHMVPLKYAWDHGADAWDQEKRVNLANDPYNLLASQGDANASKSDAGPGEWMPDNEASHCEYVTQFAYVVGKYDLSVAPQDHSAMENVLTSC